MSTYLVAFVVGKFDYVEERSTDGVLVRVYTPVGKKEQGRFGMYAPAKVLADFAAGARVGNWRILGKK